jgi:hypothetical protein
MTRFRSGLGWDGGGGAPAQAERSRRATTAAGRRLEERLPDARSRFDMNRSV